MSFHFSRTLSSDQTLTLSTDVFWALTLTPPISLLLSLTFSAPRENFNEVEEQVGTEAIGAKKRLGPSAAGVVLRCGVFCFFS